MASNIESLPLPSYQQLKSDAPVLIPLHLANHDLAILTASSPEYSRIHLEYNTWNVTLPLAKIFPRDVDQLRIIVRFCTSRSPPVPMTVRGGGHDAYGRNTLARGVQLDLRLMRWTRLIPDRQGSLVAAVGPGTTGIEMQRVLDAAGFAAAMGWTGSVGVIGWACGGGYGFETGAWGLGVDNIQGAKIVTADGNVVDTDDDDELCWAIRGAGLGNFGVICELRLELYDTPRYLAGFLAFSMVEAKEVLRGFQNLVDDGLPPSFSGELLLHTTPDGPVVNVLFAWTCLQSGDITEGWSYHAKLKALGKIAFDTVAETSVLAHHEQLHATPEFNSRGYTTMHSLSLARITDTLIDILVSSPIPEGTGGGVMFHHAHGRALQPNDKSVWAHRDQHYIWTPFGFAGLDASPAQKMASKKWADDLFDAVDKAGLGMEKAYWSLSRPEHCDAERYFGETAVSRLKNLKKRINPSDAFPAALPLFGSFGKQHL